MNRIFKILVSLLLIAFIFGAGITVLANQDQRYDIFQETAKDEALNQIRDFTGNIDIYTIGDINPKFYISSARIYEVSTIRNIQAVKGSINTLWISNEIAKDILKDVEQLNNMLKEGFSVYFIGFTEQGVLEDLFTEDQAGKISKRDPDYYSISQFKDGTILIGRGFFNGDLNDEEFFENLIVSVWKNRDVSKLLSPDAEMTSLNQYIPLAYASGASFMDFEANWRNTGWYKETHYAGAEPNLSLVEWWRITYARYNSQDYYAMGSVFHQSPGVSGWWNRRLYNIYDGNYYQSGNDLFTYGPEAIPSQGSTVQFTIGLGSSGWNIETSYGATVNELSYDTTGSNAGANKFQGNFHYLEKSSYSAGMCTQAFNVIFQRSSGNMSNFLQEYRARFISGLNITVQTDTAYYDVKIYK